MKKEILDYLNNNRSKHLDDLFDFLRIPSISADSSCSGHIEEAAQFLKKEIEGLGFQTEIIRTSGNPLVYAQTTIDPSKKTLLFYGHYDVQPVDPLELWKSEPFNPVLEGTTIYARGASDDKGQLYSHLKAIEAWVKTGNEIPVNIKLIFEGEEECGGHAVYEFTENNAEKLACDAVIVSDTSLYNAQTPAICYSLRGMSYMEIKLTGPSKDLHSGSYGGAVQNPANALCEIIAGLKDSRGHILIPGFYDDVVILEDDERKSFASLNYTDADLNRETGAVSPFGESGYTTLERMWARPTCDVNGMISGYTGEGAKTIIPATASAKISMRLVPHQNPEKISEAFTAWVKKICPSGVSIEVINHHGANPVMVERDGAMLTAGSLAMEAGFGKKPVFIREGGSIPIVGTFKSELNAPVLLLGYGLPDDNIHSPNEKYELENYYNGIICTATLLKTASEV